jgi:ATP-dependent helicase HrpA
MLAQADQVAYLRKKYPLGLAARVELPRLGVGGTTMEDLLRLAAEGALGSVLRDAASFALAAQKARGEWHVAALPVGKALDTIVSMVPKLLEWCDRQRGSKFLAAVAIDIEEQLQWMLREQFAWRAGHEALCDYPRHLLAIQQRIDRLQSLPIQKDLEKMDRVRELWVPWFDAWKSEPQRCEIWPIGWMLLEYRVSLFSPHVPVKGSISEKKIRAAMLDLLG